MGYHPRIEDPDTGCLITTRSRNSELWFVNNRKLEHSILANAAKYTERHNVSLYAFGIEGNHYHQAAQFEEMNRAAYMRDFNSSVARAVDRDTPEYPGGSFWARRYSSEVLPAPEDIEEYFFYVVLQAVKDGLVSKISDYPGYNCFNDAVRGITRKFKLVNWTSFYEAKRRDKHAKITDHMETFSLRYARIPGYEHLSQKEYANVMKKKLAERTRAIVRERREKGLGFVGREALLRTKRGAVPKSTKTSNRDSHRPRVLCVCNRRRAEYRRAYFEIYFAYKYASEKYRKGCYWIEFPPGTYKPPIHYELERPPTTIH